MSIGERDAPSQNKKSDGIPEKLNQRKLDAERLADGDMSSVMINPEINGVSKNFFRLVEELNYAECEQNKGPVLPKDATPGQIAHYIDKHLMADIKNSLEIS